MLFVESKSLSHKIEGTSRTRLLEELQEKNLTPLIRSARLNCFDHVLLGPERIGEIETAVATWTESENCEPYVRGDLFCLNDHVFFLIFDDKARVPGIRAGIVYEASRSEEHTSELQSRVDLVCR